MLKTTVSLNSVEFYAFHGYYAEEKRIGNHFVVDVSCVFAQTADRFVNYEHLFAAVNSVMKQKKQIDFLEELVEEIIELIKTTFDFLEEISVEVLKKTPPIPKFAGKGASVKTVWTK